MGPTYWTHNMYQIHDNMHFLHEISLRMKFSNLGDDLLFWVMTKSTSHHPIWTENLYMSSQCHIISHFHVVTYLFDSPDASNS